MTSNWKELLSEKNSPYKIAKVETVARGKQIPPQKIYTYVRKNYIASSINKLNHIEVNFDDAVEYIERMLKKDAKKESESIEQT